MAYDGLVAGGEFHARRVDFRQLEFATAIILKHGVGTPTPLRVPYGMPKIPPALLDCTFYLYDSRDDAIAGKEFGGTGFIVGYTSQAYPNEIAHMYGVTNWHVAVRDGSSVMRLHRKDGTAQIFEFGPEQWQFIPGEQDIAAIPIPLNQAEHKFSYVPDTIFAEKTVIEKHGIDAGEDVVMVGRFVDHDGREQNNPACRFGNISLMPSQIEQPNGAMQESYCIDMHSRSGYSGSPVFTYRTPGTNLASGGLNMMDQFLLLLGIHWGQFPEMWELTDKKKLSESAKREPLIVEGLYIKGLSGMTCVSPAWRIREVLDLPVFKSGREKMDKVYAQIKDLKPLPPLAETATKSKSNPTHREDFNRLLGAAVKPPKSSDQT